MGKEELPDVAHLAIKAARTGPAMNMNVGIVHRLEGEAVDELERLLREAVTAVAERFGWTA